jgi:hypothetical protein
VGEWRTVAGRVGDVEVEALHVVGLVFHVPLLSEKLHPHDAYFFPRDNTQVPDSGAPPDYWMRRGRRKNKYEATLKEISPFCFFFFLE